MRTQTKSHIRLLRPNPYTVQQKAQAHGRMINTRDTLSHPPPLSTGLDTLRLVKQTVQAVSRAFVLILARAQPGPSVTVRRDSFCAAGHEMGFAEVVAYPSQICPAQDDTTVRWRDPPTRFGICFLRQFCFHAQPPKVLQNKAAARVIGSQRQVSTFDSWGTM